MIEKTKTPLPFQFFKVEFFDLVRRGIVGLEVTRLVISKQQLYMLSPIEREFVNCLLMSKYTEYIETYEISIEDFSAVH